MRTSKVLYITILVLVMFSACLAVWLHYQKTGIDLLSFTISTVGLCIALLALFIAVRTYTSIDSVNTISKMEGNILDNENYVTSLPELVNRYKSEDEKLLDKELFESIEYKLKKESHTAVLFADTLQYMIDLIVLFPAVFNASEIDKKQYKNRMANILHNVDKQRDILQSISKGNSIQITESIKLLKAVISYQSFVADGNFNIHSDLLHVRGPILRNPVTRTIYHNYLGLYYNKKGMHLIKCSLNMETIDILSIDGLNKVQSKINSISPSIIEEVNMYLRSACEQFDRALTISSEDIMWPGFINYNKARTLYFLSFLSQPTESWEKAMDNSIQSRSRLNRLIDEILTTDRINSVKVIDTHLRTFFLYQEELARLVKVNILLSKNTQTSNSTQIMYKGINLENIPKKAIDSLFSEIKSFPTIKIYQEKFLRGL
ncbi:hypothetical protein AB4160_06155 [Shewanella sp. 10N.286.51.B8]|uniref:hypothetical protein n=1 Tax=Shewanella sp. 10N.286.51.B8 TaxID=3229708 RepID=UPI003551611B